MFERKKERKKEGKKERKKERKKDILTSFKRTKMTYKTEQEITS